MPSFIFHGNQRRLYQVQFSSWWHQCARNSLYYPVFQKFPQRRYWSVPTFVWLRDNVPLSSFQGRLSSASSFHASLIQVVDGVMSLALCPQVESTLQALAYDIFPSTTAVFIYAIGSRKLSANEQFFVVVCFVFCWCSNSSKFVINNSDYIRR